MHNMQNKIQIIEKVREEGRTVLTEAESKLLLGSYGLPVVEEYIATTAEEVLERSSMIGFPMVLKGLGAKLTHKTEKGLVKLNLAGIDDLTRACIEIKESAGKDLEGYLLQPMLQGRREFVTGIFRDAQFGPVVMFGLGGIFTEAIGDVVFRIAPITEAQAGQMSEEILSYKLLGDFRGEVRADQTMLVRALTGLSRLAMEHPEIKEVDVNPLLIGPDGRVTAVDALVVLEEDAPEAKDTKPRVEEGLNKVREIHAALEVMLNPQSIAVVGVPRAAQSGWVGLFGCIKNFGYPGRLYPINPHAEEIDGIKAYPSLTSVPESIDLVLVSVPAPLVPDVLRDCIASENKNIHIFTAGFKETGEEDGLRLQSEIEEIAREGQLRVIGPNCMGLYVPKLRVVTWMAAPTESGPVAFVSQSGGHAGDFTRYANEFGIHFSKAISYGNALTLDSTDFLEYLAEDDETSIITMYLEGVKDGRRLLELVGDINRKKPIVILKGGLTDSGARAVASHTGSLAGGVRIWNAFFRQTGAVKVESLEEMSDIVLALLRLKAPVGRNVAIIGAGGGVGVAAADIFAGAGLDLPPLSEDVRKSLREFIPPAGTMIRNPIDVEQAFVEPSRLERVLEIVSAEPYIDIIAISIHMDWLYDVEKGSKIKLLTPYLCESARHHTHGKPMIVSLRSYRRDPEVKQAQAYVIEELAKAGVPVYEGLPRAARALSKLVQYHEFLMVGV